MEQNLQTLFKIGDNTYSTNNNLDNNSSDIETYYKNIDKPFMNDCVNKYNLKNILELSTLTNLYMFSKKKNKEWKLKEKINLLKECQNKRKNLIKNISKDFLKLIILKENNDIKKIKDNSFIFFNELEKIDLLIFSIENSYPISEEKYLEIFSN